MKYLTFVFTKSTNEGLYVSSKLYEKIVKKVR